MTSSTSTYIDPREPDDLAAAMRRLLEDETLRQDLIARGVKRAAELTWERTVVQVVRAYREAAASR